MVLFNDSIDFVQRFHWICSFNLPLLLLPSVILTVSFWQFRQGRWATSSAATIVRADAERIKNRRKKRENVCLLQLYLLHLQRKRKRVITISTFGSWLRSVGVWESRSLDISPDSRNPCKRAKTSIVQTPRLLYSQTPKSLKQPKLQLLTFSYKPCLSTTKTIET